MTERLGCALAGRCGGCPWHDRDLDGQRAEKVAVLAAAAQARGFTLPDAAVVDAGAREVRDKFDLQLIRGGEGPPVLGLSQLTTRALLDVDRCALASPALQAWLDAFRADLPPRLTNTSIRLRVAPDGARGVWLDGANVEIKALLDEGDWLARAHAAGVVVELGQRRKEATWWDGAWKLRDAPPRPWFQTWLQAADGDAPAPLFGRVGGFSQPGYRTNRALVGAVRDAAAALPDARRWLEVGCGNGNLTLPLASLGREVVGVDLDRGALDGLRAGAEAAGLSSLIEIAADNLEHARLAARLDAADAVLVDPPRSGLRALAHALAAPRGGGPRHLVYVSCSTDSLLDDLAALGAGGWTARAVVLVDQFAWSPHAEWVVTLAR